MSAQKATEIEGSIEAGHAEQVRNVLSTIVAFARLSVGDLTEPSRSVVKDSRSYW